MLHTDSVDLSKIKEESRLNPKYFRFLKERNKLVKSSSIKFLRLGDKRVTKIITDGEHQAINLYEQDKIEDGIRYLYVHNVKEGIIDLTDSLYISRKDHERLKRSQLNKGNVLLTIVGTIGKSAMVYDCIDEANIPRNISKIVVNEENILPEFLVAFFLSQFGREQSVYTSGGNLQGLLSLTKVRSMVVPVPDISIQHKIGDVYLEALDKETEAIKLIGEAKNHFYEKLAIDFTQFKKRIFFQTDWDELNESDLWTPMYRFPLFLEIEDALRSKWKVKKIVELFDVTKGHEVGSANYYDFFVRKEGSVPFVRTSDMVNYEIDQDPDYFIPYEIYEELNQDLKTSDILFTNDGKIGEVSILTKSDKCIIQSHIKALRIKKDVSIDPYYVFIPLMIKEIGGFQCKRFTVIQSTIPTISNRINDIIVPIIDDEDMIHIATLVKKAFALKDQKKKLLRTMKVEMNQLLEYKQ